MAAGGEALFWATKEMKWEADGEVRQKLPPSPAGCGESAATLTAGGLSLLPSAFSLCLLPPLTSGVGAPEQKALWSPQLAAAAP